MLIFGSIVFGVGMVIYFDVFVFLLMLIFGFLVCVIDCEWKVIVVCIVSDVCVFFVIIFVFVGVVFDIVYVGKYWLEVLIIIVICLVG